MSRHSQVWLGAAILVPPYTAAALEGFRRVLVPFLLVKRIALRIRQGPRLGPVGSWDGKERPSGKMCRLPFLKVSGENSCL
jgi:hypothetical protein